LWLMDYETSICHFQYCERTHRRDYLRLVRFGLTMSIRVNVRLLPTRKESRTLELNKGATVEAAIRALNLFPDAWVAVRGDTPLPLDEPLKDKDDIKLISVVSGG
jgi:sulfur carrier protein ThiS